MRYVQSAALVALSILSSSALMAQGQNTLSITNYQYVTQTPLTPTLWRYTFSATVVNNGLPLNSVSATIQSGPCCFSEVQPTLNFGPVATNGQAQSLNTFTINVNRVTSPPFDVSQLVWTFSTTPALPIANAGTAQTVPIGQKVTLDGSASTNPGGVGTLTYNWTLTPPSTSHAVLILPNTVNPFFTPDIAGTYTATLTVSNGSGTSAPSSVNISTSNSAPTANAGQAQTVPVDTTVTLDGSGSTDIDGDQLTYSWVLSAPGNSTATLSNPNTVKPTFYVDVPGTYTATLTVNDGHGNTNSAGVQITTLNSPPVANAGPAQSVNIGATVTLDGSKSTDVDGDPLTYSWSFTNIPATSTAVINNPTSVNPTFTVDVGGEYDIQLIVNDGHNHSVTATTKVTTNTVLAPTANAGNPQTVGVGSLVTLSGSGNDPNVPPLPLTYSWSLVCKPSGSTASLSGANGTSPTFTADVPSTNTGTCNDNFVAQLIVSNGYQSSTPSTVTISSSVNAPVANPGNPQSVQIGTLVTLNGSGSSDPNGLTLGYAWTVTSTPSGSNISTASLTGANTASPTFTPDVAGPYVLQLIVRDTFLSSSPQTVTITANAPNSISLSPNPLNFDLNSSGTLTVTISPAAGPSGQLINLLNGNPSAVSLPSSVTVPATQTSTTVTISPVGSGGSASITGFFSGYQPGRTNVNVTTPTITLTMNSSLALSSSEAGTITLSSPAPGAGVTVNVSANPTGVLSFDNTSVFIAGGTSTGTFNATSIGTGNGSTTVTASLSPYTSGTAAVNVQTAGQITLPSTLTIGTNTATIYPVQLATPAGVNGVTVTLQSSDPNVTFNPSQVTINQGTKSPTTPPQVTGTIFTTSNITATAPGFGTGTGTITVSDTLSFTQSSTFILTGATQNLTLNLSNPAPASGVTINLSSTNTSVATAPSTVFIAGNATSVSVPVTGVAQGTATIHASNANLADVSSSVQVLLLGQINLSNLTVQAGQQTPLGISLSSAAPQGGLTINLSTSDNTKVSLNQTSVTIPAGQMAPTVQPQVTGILVGTNVATISASGNGLTSASSNITVTAGTAASVTVSAASSPQTATVAANFANQIVITVKDAGQNVVPNAAVTITPPSTGASAVFSPAGPYTTNSNGQVTVTATANTVSGTYSVTVGAANTTSTATLSLTNTAGNAANISVGSGSGQTQTVATQFNSPLVATVTDTYSNPVPGVTVNFVSQGSTASATFAPPNPLTTNAQGQATVVATANSSVGSYTVNATAVGVASPAIFTLTNKAGNPNTITVAPGQAGNNQSAQINAQFINPLKAIVKDSAGNPVQGAQVNFAGPGSGASIVAASATTDATGVASALVTANSVASTTAYTVSATVQGYLGAGTATFSLTNNTAPAAFIIVTPSSNGTPQSATVNNSFLNPLSVTVQDAGHNPVSGVSVTFTVPASTGPSATITGTLTTNASGIVAASATANTHANTSANPNYNVTASVAGVSPSATFVLTNNPGTATAVVAGTGGGQSANVGTQFVNPLVVTVNDQYGNAVADGTLVTFAGPGSGASITTTTATTTGGVASTKVTANGAIGGPYNVTASAGSGSATFSLSNTTTPASVSPVSGSGQTATVGTAFANQLKAIVKDASLNPVPNVTVTFGGPGSGPGLQGGSVNAITDATGTATTTGLTANTVPGSYPISISVNGTLNTPSAFNLTNIAGTASAITATGGTPQTATVATQFATALSVTVKDQYGNNVADGTTVTFAGPTGSVASIVQKTATTTAGVASVLVSANNIAGGPYTVTASAGTGSATFSLTNLAGSPAIVTYSSGTGQSTSVNSPFANPLVVTVTDSLGNLVTGATVTFTGPPSGPGISGSPTATTVAGVASVNVTANGTLGGPYSVTASVGTASNATFSLTNATSSPAAITCVTGCGQSATIYNAFGTMQAKVKDLGGNPIQGVLVTFSAATNSSGATGTFVGGPTATAVTDATGVATAPTFVANGVGTTTVGSTTYQFSSFNLTASVNTPGVSPANFALTNNNTSSTQISVANGSVGNGLQSYVIVTLPSPCPAAYPSSCVFTAQPSDGSKLLLSGGPTRQGATGIGIGIQSGNTTTEVFLQGLANSGNETLSIIDYSGLYTTGTSNVFLTPAGFVLIGPAPLQVGAAGFNTAVGAPNSVLTVQAAQLDPTTLTYLPNQLNQSVTTGTTVSVPVTSSSPSVGQIFGSVTFTGNDTSYTVTLQPNNFGSTTVTAAVPTGFSTPGQSQNQLAVSVSATGISSPSAMTIGSNLETSMQVGFVGSVQGGTTVTVTSNDPTHLKFSLDPTVAGSTSINVMIPYGVTQTNLTPTFYVQGFASTGSATYSVSDPIDGLNTVTGTVNFAPSGFVVASSGGVGQPLTTNAVGVGLGLAGLTVYPGVLDSSFHYTGNNQLIAGGVSVTVNLNSSATGVGTYGPVTLTGGSASASSNLTILSPGTATITVQTPTSPSGFTTPLANNGIDPTSIALTVQGLGVQFLSPPTILGQNLEVGGTLQLQSAPSSDVVLTVSTTNPNLLISSSFNTVGSSSAQITVPAGQTTATYWLQGFNLSAGTGANTGSASYAASAPGYSTANSTINFVPSAVAITNVTNAPPIPPAGSISGDTASISLTGYLAQSVGPVQLGVVTVPLNSDGSYDTVNGPIEYVSPSLGAVTVNLTNQVSSIGTLSTTSVTIPIANAGNYVTFTPTATGTGQVKLQTGASLPLGPVATQKVVITVGQ